MPILPTKSALLHMRFFFSFFLLPVYVFALSQASAVHIVNAVLVFTCWHVFVYPASNGYNSYFDKDEDSIALLERPPAVDKSLYWYALLFDFIGFILGLMVSIEFAAATLIYGALSKMYSHPAIRLKKNPYASFLVVFIFQGAFVYWTSLAGISDKSVLDLWDADFMIGASYPLTQVYQHEEDARRGDKTLSIVLGIKGSFIFSGLLFGAGVLLMFLYWDSLHQLSNFWLFLVFILPVMLLFLSWFTQVLKDPSMANFKNMSRMTMLSGIAMLVYFLFVWMKAVLG
jgi:1,4-dihydroxy-2-naphthoate octaprenyltransferase